MVKSPDCHKPIHLNVNKVMPPSSLPSTPGTLLLPSDYEELLEQRMQKLGIPSVGIYFHFLLQNYKNSIFDKKFPKSNRIKTQYQDSGKQLLRLSLRVSNNDWMVLSQISLAMGYSRCRVFVMLLELDLGLVGEIEGVLTPRCNSEGKIIQYAIVITQIIFPSGDKYQKRLRLYELSRLRNPLIRSYPEYYNMDGSFKLNRN